MEFLRWLPFYSRITREFGYSEEGDMSAAQLLSVLLEENGNAGNIVPQHDTWRILREKVEVKRTIIFGAADTVVEHIRRLKKEGRMAGRLLVAADGATSALLENDIVPDVVVTDLDGRMEDIERCINGKGTIAIVHAHGDNMEALRKWLPRFRGRVVGTTQNEPFADIRNYGGFTDGDRAAFIMDSLGALPPIVLAGFDFEKVGEYSFGTGGEMNGEYSLATGRETKLGKLEWARRLLGELECEIL